MHHTPGLSLTWLALIRFFWYTLRWLAGRLMTSLIATRMAGERLGRYHFDLSFPLRIATEPGQSESDGTAFAFLYFAVVVSSSYLVLEIPNSLVLNGVTVFVK